MVEIRVCPWCGIAYNAIHLAVKDWCFHTFWTLLEGKRLFGVRNREREKALGVFDALKALSTEARARSMVLLVIQY